MPISTGSATSVGSAGSKAKNKRYHLINRSGADENLFGAPQRCRQMTGDRSWSNSRSEPLLTADKTTQKSPKGRRPSESGVVQVITKDLIRKIKIPQTPDPSGGSIILHSEEFSRICSAATMMTKERRAEFETTIKQEKDAKREAAAARKKEMQEWELKRKQHEKPSDLEEEEQLMRQELTGKAKARMEEQDDEIKKLNEVILNAKCHAIRDMQLQEREEIKKSMTEEEERLDMMMELERQRELKKFEEGERERQIQRLKGADVIRQQIEARNQERMLEAERRDQETQAMLEYLERLQKEDMDNLYKKRDTQKTLMDEVGKCNEEIKMQKLKQREQEKLEDMKVMAYMKDKERREEEYQKELERQKAEKEREVALLRAQQERAKDRQAERDALRAKRNQEEFERDWRRKEKEEAQKKAQTDASLKKARENQVRNKEHFMAVEAQRDRDEFERIVRAQQESMMKTQDEELKHHHRRMEHAKEVRKQVRQKEQERIDGRKAFFEEGIKIDQEARERRKRLDEIKQRKLNELRGIGIPEKYCAEVSRRLTAPPPSFTMS